MPLGLRLLIGRCLNVMLAVPVISWLSSSLMTWAEYLTGDQFGWPQISFMSAYPDHIRNGYLMFASAVLAYVLFSSGLVTILAGASPGKALFGVAFAGPSLGFIFGPVADPWSLVALILGLGIAVFAILPSPTTHVSRMDRKLGIRPVLRTSLSSEV